MSVTQQASVLQQFAPRFAEELKFLADQSATGELTGAQISDCAMDIIRIDMRRSDVLTVVHELPLEFRNLIEHAFRNPGFSWAAPRQLEMVKTVGGLRS